MQKFDNLNKQMEWRRRSNLNRKEFIDSSTTQSFDNLRRYPELNIASPSPPLLPPTLSGVKKQLGISPALPLWVLHIPMIREVLLGFAFGFGKLVSLRFLKGDGFIRNRSS
ncbi:unnamed protein product [Microthlaspi erraticum]|uniref:Uncharacterized protein n=1 Tax=Microthlaspi erraticum TaxID=1685480 RepID=A0A6D2I6V6_9BRAS|nr:unnamed protein product [Microthlaspi erraticum]